MSHKKLMDSFKEAVESVRIQQYVDPFRITVERLCSHFALGYEVADSEKTKRELVKGLADFAVETAKRQAPYMEAAKAFGDAVEQICDTLDKTVEDKSFIPETLSKRLLAAAQDMSTRKGGSQYVEAMAQSTQKVIAAARKMRPAVIASAAPAPEASAEAAPAPKPGVFKP